MSAARILILSASHLCRNPRVLKEATTLGAAGYDVTVLTVSFVPRFAQMDRELMRGRPFKLETLDYARTDARTRAANLLQRGATYIARWMVHRLRWETAQALGPSSALLQRARGFPADLTIVHTEIPVWAARALIQEGRRVAVDMEDWSSEDLLFRDRVARPLKLIRRSEALALRGAAYSSATSECMAAALAAAYDCPAPIVLRNSFPLQAVSRIDRPIGDEPPKFIWFSQTIGPGRGLELFLAAWARTSAPSKLYLLGDELPGYHAKLRKLLPAHRRDDLHILTPVPFLELPALLAEFDIGLALEMTWPRNRDIAISNKALQYLNAGLAVIATATTGQSELLQSAPEVGFLIKAGETTQLTRQLDELLSDRPRLRAMQTAARRAAVSRFTWEHETPRLLAAVQAALSQR